MDSSTIINTVFSRHWHLSLKHVKHGRKTSQGTSRTFLYQYFSSDQQNGTAEQKALKWLMGMYCPKSGRVCQPGEGPDFNKLTTPQTISVAEAISNK